MGLLVILIVPPAFIPRAKRTNKRTFGMSYVVSYVAGIEIGGKSLTNHIKDGVQSGIKTIAGWFT